MWDPVNFFLLASASNDNIVRSGVIGDPRHDREACTNLARFFPTPQRPWQHTYTATPTQTISAHSAGLDAEEADYPGFGITVLILLVFNWWVTPKLIIGCHSFSSVFAFVLGYHYC